MYTENELKYANIISMKFIENGWCCRMSKTNFGVFLIIGVMGFSTDKKEIEPICKKYGFMSMIKNIENWTYDSEEYSTVRIVLNN